MKWHHKTKKHHSRQATFVYVATRFFMMYEDPSINKENSDEVMLSHPGSSRNLKLVFIASMVKTFELTHNPVGSA